MDNLKQNIRKWNHDILTHMIGITYLMDMQRYPEAERYCEKILNSLSAFSETFRTRATFPDPDSVSESPVSTDYLPDGFIEYQEKLPAEITAFQTLLQQKKYPEAHYKLHLLTTEFDRRRPQPVPADDIIKNIVDEVRN